MVPRNYIALFANPSDFEIILKKSFQHIDENDVILR